MYSAFAVCHFPFKLPIFRMIFIPCKVVIAVDILDDDDGDDDIMLVIMMGMIRVMMMMVMMMILMVSPCKVVLVVDILDDEMGVDGSPFLLPDDLIATSFENGFFQSLDFLTSRAAFIIMYYLVLRLYYLESSML